MSPLRRLLVGWDVINLNSTHKKSLGRPLYLFLIFCLGCSVVSAEVNVSQSLIPIQKSIAKPFFEGYFSLDYDSKILEKENRENENSLSWYLRPKINLSEVTYAEIKARVVQHQFTQNKESQSETEVADTHVGVGTTSLRIFDLVNLKHFLHAIIPTNKTSLEEDRLQGAVRLGNGFTTDWHDLSLTYVFGVQRNFHEFNVDREGSPNLEWTLRHSMDLSYSLSDQWIAQFSGLYLQSQTYGDRERAAFSSDIVLEYDLTPNFHINGGFSNQGSALAANGSNSNLKIYDDKSSSWHMGMEVLF